MCEGSASSNTAVKRGAREFLLLGIALTLVSTVTALAGRQTEHHSAATKTATKTPVKLIGAIYLPGNPLRFDISWVDQPSGRFFLAEAGNASVDVIDAGNGLFLGRIAGFHGVGLPDDPCGPIQGMGPSGVVMASNNRLWADDAHGTVKVFDMTDAQPPFNKVTPIATISTGAQCRADEIGFDPKDHVIMVGNPAEKPPYATLISSDPPFAILSKIPFPNARGFEQPVWDPDLKGGRMLATVPGNEGGSQVVVFNLKDPKEPIVESSYPTGNCGSGLALGPSQRLLVGCGGGKPLLVLDAVTGKELGNVADTKGADEVWYNPGDNNFYAPSAFGGNPTLSVIDAESGTLITTLPAGPGSHSVAAFQGNNHIFVPIAIPTTAAPEDACNVLFGLPAKQGCVAVYAHEK